MRRALQKSRAKTAWNDTGNTTDSMQLEQSASGEAGDEARRISTIWHIEDYSLSRCQEWTDFR